MRMSEFERKTITFMACLQDAYRDDEDKESHAISRLQLESGNLTEDFTAMIYAIYLIYKEITGDDVDVFGFTHIVNRLVFQRLMEDEIKIE